MWLASLHYMMTLVTFLLILPAILFLAVRVIVKHRPQTKFFYNWSAMTTLYLFYVYEIKAVGTFWDLPKLISWYENLVLVIGILLSAGLFWKLKSDYSRIVDVKDGKMCRVCGVHVRDKDHHCVWLDMCISGDNINTFIMFLSVTIMTTCHLSLMLTSYACPGMLLGPVLLPSLCWPDKYNDKLLLVSGIYSGVIAAILTLLLCGQLCRKFRQLK